MTDPDRQERWTVPVSKLREVERKCEEVTRQMEEEQAAVEQRVRKLEEALRVAADDLGKAANQFASIKASQAAGHNPRIENNPRIFIDKERCARAALIESEDS